MLANGFSRYVGESSNIFDGTVVLVSLFELSLDGSGRWSIFRAFRLFRVFKLARKWTKLRDILRSVCPHDCGAFYKVSFTLCESRTLQCMPVLFSHRRLHSLQKA